MNQRTATEDKAFIETDRYIYSNPITRWLTNMGHSACADLREFDSPGSLVMDLGCGGGAHFSYVRRAEIVAVDIRSEMLAIAHKETPGHSSLVQGDIFRLPFKDDSVISIVSFGVLEHLSPLEVALREIHRVLDTGGEFIFGIPCEGFLYRLARNFTTKRHVEKATGVNYDELLAKEHVNRCGDILKQLEEFFTIQKLVGVPFLAPSINLNFVLCGRCIKKGRRGCKRRS